MDWQKVTFGEVVDALKTVSWSAPRPLSEFFRAFGPPRGLTGRLKNNLYYYRTNYLVILFLSFIICFLRNPAALASLGLVALGLSCCNDPFATGLNDTLLHALRKVAPRMVARARAKAGSDGVVGLHKRRRVYIVLLPRSLLVAALLCGGLGAVYASHAVLTLSWAVLLGEATRRSCTTTATASEGRWRSGGAGSAAAAAAAAVAARPAVCAVYVGGPLWVPSGAPAVTWAPGQDRPRVAARRS
ncbi:hypothetical protein PLESTM_001137800 [Pleodorina starrii]|nr:hypothetical protein PLESTM_001137800 [Pleodorina starrii]